MNLKRVLMLVALLVLTLGFSPLQQEVPPLPSITLDAGGQTATEPIASYCWPIAPNDTQCDFALPEEPFTTILELPQGQAITVLLVGSPVPPTSLVVTALSADGSQQVFQLTPNVQAIFDQPLPLGLNTLQVDAEYADIAGVPAYVRYNFGVEVFSDGQGGALPVPTEELLETEETPEITPEATEEMTPEEIQEEAAVVEETLETTPEVTQETTPEVTQEVAVLPSASNDDSDDQGAPLAPPPAETEEMTPEVTQEVTPEVTEEASPVVEETPEATPEATMEMTPEVTEEASPVVEETPETTPEATEEETAPLPAPQSDDARPTFTTVPLQNVDSGQEIAQATEEATETPPAPVAPPPPAPDSEPAAQLVFAGRTYMPVASVFCQDIEGDAEPLCTENSAEPNVPPVRLLQGFAAQFHLLSGPRPQTITVSYINTETNAQVSSLTRPGDRVILFNIDAPTGDYLMLVAIEWGSARIEYSYLVSVE